MASAMAHTCDSPAHQATQHIIPGVLTCSSRQVVYRMSEGAQATDRTRSVQTLSTKGIFVVLAWFHAWRRRRLDKARAGAIGIGLLTRCWPDYEDADRMMKVALEHSWHSCLDAPTGGCCKHLAEVVASFSCVPDMQGRLLSGIFALVGAAFRCEAAAHAAEVVIALLPEIVDKFLPEKFDSTDPLRHLDLERRANVRVRRDEDYRTAIMEWAVKSGKARSSSGAGQLAGVRGAVIVDWQHKQMSPLLTSCWRQFEGFTGAMGLYEDAARLGHPAEDTMVMVAESASQGMSVYLPHQVARAQGGVVGGRPMPRHGGLLIRASA